MYDLNTVTKEELVGTYNWESPLNTGVESLEGFLVWFDMYFADRQSEKPVPAGTSAQEWAASGPDRVAFTTGPFGQETHWKSGLLLSEQPSSAAGWGEAAGLSGEIALSVPEDDARALTLRVEWTEPSGTKKAQSWAVR